MSEFALNIQDLESGGKEYTFPLRREWLASALQGSDLRPDERAPDGAFDVQAQKSGSDVLVQGELRGRLLTACVRCLEDAAIDVDTRIVALFSPRGGDARARADEDELDPESPDHEVFSGDEIVLDDLVREHLLLELPMQPLCSESCKGIEIPEHVRPPADFGRESSAEAGIDPRLAPLKGIARRLGGRNEE